MCPCLRGSGSQVSQTGAARVSGSCRVDDHEREGLLMTYRKRNDKDTWHWCRNCSNWPTTNYKEQQTKPTTGELCNECQAKQKAGTCNS